MKLPTASFQREACTCYGIEKQTKNFFLSFRRRTRGVASEAMKESRVCVLYVETGLLPRMCTYVIQTVCVYL